MCIRDSTYTDTNLARLRKEVIKYARYVRTWTAEDKSTIAASNLLELLFFYPSQRLCKQAFCRYFIFDLITRIVIISLKVTISDSILSTYHCTPSPSAPRLLNTHQCTFFQVFSWPSNAVSILWKRDVYGNDKHAFTYTEMSCRIYKLRKSAFFFLKFPRARPFLKWRVQIKGFTAFEKFVPFFEK